MAVRREGHGGPPIGPEIPAREMGLASAMETHDAEISCKWETEKTIPCVHSFVIKEQ